MKDKNPGYLKPKKLLKKKQQQRLYDWESERGHSNNKILRDNGDHTLLVHFFILDCATWSQKDHKLFSAIYIVCSKKNQQLKDRRFPITNKVSLLTPIFCVLSFFLYGWNHHTWFKISKRLFHTFVHLNTSQRVNGDNELGLPKLL